MRVHETIVVIVMVASDETCGCTQLVVTAAVALVGGDGKEH